MEGDVAPNVCWYQETRAFLLPHSEDPVILSSFVWIWYQRVTHGQTDEQTELPWKIQRSALEQCGRSVKNGASATDLSCFQQIVSRADYTMPLLTYLQNFEAVHITPFWD